MDEPKLRKKTIEQFVNANGYEIAEKQGITAASTASNLSRPTVYAILQKYPKQPKRILSHSTSRTLKLPKAPKNSSPRTETESKLGRKCYRLGLRCSTCLRKEKTL